MSSPILDIVSLEVCQPLLPPPPSRLPPPPPRLPTLRTPRTPVLCPPQTLPSSPNPILLHPPPPPPSTHTHTLTSLPPRGSCRCWATALRGSHRAGLLCCARQGEGLASLLWFPRPHLLTPVALTVRSLGCGHQRHLDICQKGKRPAPAQTSEIGLGAEHPEICV